MAVRSDAGDSRAIAAVTCWIACSTIVLASCGGGSSGMSTPSAPSTMPSMGTMAGPISTAASAKAASSEAADDDATEEGFRTVAKAHCGANDHPETGLQGQVSAALRASGFHGFNCNLNLVGQVRGDGANWQTAEFKDRVHKCAYHGTSYATANRTQLGVPVADVTNPAQPTVTGYLTTSSMLDPWESLKVNERRQLLAADEAFNGGLFGTGGPAIDIYDLSDDCRYPQLLANIGLGFLFLLAGYELDPQLLRRRPGKLAILMGIWQVTALGDGAREPYGQIAGPCPARFTSLAIQVRDTSTEMDGI